MERHAAILEDTCQIHPTNDGQHTSLVELHVILNGVNLHYSGNLRYSYIHTWHGIYYWLTITLTGKSQERNNASCEILIRRRLTLLPFLNLIPSSSDSSSLQLIKEEYRGGRIPPSHIRFLLQLIFRQLLLLLRFPLLVSDTQATTADIASAEAAALVVAFAEVTAFDVAAPSLVAALAVFASADVATTSRPL